MRRIHLLLAALTVVVTSFAAFSGPAMADDWENDWEHNGNVAWHSNDGGWDDWDNDDLDNNWWWANDWDDDDLNHDWDNSSWWANDWHQGCEGPVCLID